MSWGYWGIVTGLLALVTVFFVCVDLMYRDRKNAMPDTHALDDRGTAPTTGSRHAA